MRRASLAKQLVSTANGAERKKLIIDNIALADLQLAEEIKKICFAAWTHEPVTAQRAARALTSLRKFNGDPAIEILRILHGREPTFLWIAKRNSIFQNDPRDADLVEPFGDLGPFFVPREDIEALHGDLTQQQRDKVMQRFRQKNIQLLKSMRINRIM